MDPKERNSNQPKHSPKQQVEVLMRLRDEKHSLRKTDRPYDQDWFIGAIVSSKLEQAYMNEINFNNRF